MRTAGRRPSQRKAAKLADPRLPPTDSGARERFGTGLESVQSDRVLAQHALTGSLRFGQARLSVRDQLSKHLADHAPAIDGAHPVQLGHLNAVRTVHELGGRGDAERLPGKGEHLAVAEEGYAVGEIEVYVLVDGGEVASLPRVRVALVQQHHRQGAVVRFPEHGAQMQRVAEQEVGVGVAVTHVELDRDLLIGGQRERDVQQGVEQGLVDKPRETIQGGSAVLAERRLRLLARPLPDIQARAVGGYAFERDVAPGPHVLEGGGERLLYGSEGVVLSEQALHQDFKAQHRLRAAAAQLTQLRHREDFFWRREARVEEEGIYVGRAK